MKEINAGVIGEYRANGGRLSGPMHGAPILLLTTVGRITGTAHTTPVGFVESGGQLSVAAANGGSDHNPDWYRNIENNHRVTIEIGDQSISATASVTSGADRDRLLQQLITTLPGMSDHVGATTREIPVISFSETTDQSSR